MSRFWLVDTAAMTRRRREAWIDTAILGIAFVFALVFAYQADVFTNLYGEAPREEVVESDGLVAIGGIVGAFLLVAIRHLGGMWRHWSQHSK